jgi:hypothetical protein
VNTTRKRRRKSRRRKHDRKDLVIEGRRRGSNILRKIRAKGERIAVEREAKTAKICKI